MSHRITITRIMSICTAGVMTACSEEAPVAPAMMHDMTGNDAAVTLEAFTVRAPLDPYSIHQLPDFKIHSKARGDLIIQRSMFTGTGAWHTHPGLSYAYVLQGQVKLQKFTEKDGCSETRVFGPGEVYIKPPNEIHRAIVVGQDDEWELIVRLNFPEGGPIAFPAADPGC